MRKLLLASCVLSIGLMPAKAGTVVCVFYGSDDQVTKVVFPDNDSDCAKLQDGTINEVDFPLSMFGGKPKDEDGMLSLAAYLQEFVPQWVKTLDENPG